MLREISETEKDKYHMTSLICEIKKKKRYTHTKNCQPKLLGGSRDGLGSVGSDNLIMMPGSEVMGQQSEGRHCPPAPGEAEPACGSRGPWFPMCLSRCPANGAVGSG